MKLADVSQQVRAYGCARLTPAAEATGPYTGDSTESTGGTQANSRICYNLLGNSHIHSFY